MLDSPMIDVALGLMLFFLVMSLSVTAIQEWMSSICKLRGKNLEKGIKRLVGDDIAKEIYNHSLMKTMGTKPSYLKSKYFAKILIDIIDPNRQALKEEKNNIQKFIEKVPNPQVKKVFQTFNVKVNDKVEAIEKEICEWFDAGMERASGWYQKKIQLYSFVIAFILVICMNANTITIAQALWKNDELRAKIAAIAVNAPKLDDDDFQNKIEKTSNVFPIGWNDETKKEFKSIFQIKNNKGFINYIKGIIINIIKCFPYYLIGWLITVAAISLGAPFWFDLLGKVANIRKSKIPSKKEEE